MSTMNKDELEQMERDEQRRMEERENERRIEDAMIEHERELDELRLKIAKAKGWKFGGIDNRENSRYWVIAPNGSTVVDNSSTPENAWICAKIHDVPDYPRDIAEAFELLEEVQYEPHEQAVDLWRTVAISKRWGCSIGGKAKTGDTAPEAICRAYLAWKEKQASA